MYFLSILSFLPFIPPRKLLWFLPSKRRINLWQIHKHLSYLLSSHWETLRHNPANVSRSVGINGFDYKLKCGQTRGAACGDIVNPRTYKDCSLHSISKNSCCYYSYKGTTNYVWLGKSDVGTMKYKDLILICDGGTSV